MARHFQVAQRIVAGIASLLVAASTGPVFAQSADADGRCSDRDSTFKHGERPVTYEEMGAYLEALAGGSDRARLSVYGTTPLDRKLRLVTISSPRNISALSSIEAQLSRVSASNSSAPLPNDLPGVVWMGFGIHADELSGPDAALRLINQLICAQDDDTRRLLENLVIHVDPMANPDGRARFLTHVTSFRRHVPVLDSQDIVHTEFWPPTRFNHYLMDLNRDALYMTQEQSAARVRAIRHSQPQLFIDSHEMSIGSTFLFAVPAEPLNPYLPRAIHRGWARVAKAIADSFDTDGKSYYTRSWNEVFYPGYYDILPAYSGTTPVLFEQGRTSGVSVTLANGKIRTFDDAVANQLQSSLATLHSAAEHRADLLQDWLSARRTASRDIAGSGPQAWVVTPENPYKLHALVRILDLHGIEHERLDQPVRATGLRSTWGDAAESVSLPAGTLLVRAAQPEAGLIRNLFDFHVPMDDDFIRAERQRTDLARSTQIYDITAWSVPHAFDLNVYWSSRAPAGAWRKGPLPRASPARVAGPARYGYVYEDPSLFATARLLADGVAVRVATEGFTHGGRYHPAGTFLIRNEDQAQSFSTARAEKAATLGVFMQPIDSARILEGPDLGDDKFMLLSAPRIAVLAGTGTQGTSVGAIWQLFDQAVGVPVTLLDIGRLARFDLSRYNVLVLPDAEDRGRLASLLSGSAAIALKAWVTSGGTLVAQGGGVTAASEAGLTTITPRAKTVERTPPLMLGRSARAVMRDSFLSAGGAHTDIAAPEGPQDTAPVISEAVQSMLGERRPAYVFPRTLPSYAEWAQGIGEPDRLQKTIPAIVGRYLPRGAYLTVNLRPMHWLRYGANDRVPALFREPDAMIAEAPVEIVGRFAAPRELVLAGLVWPEAVGYIAETTYLAREPQGSGQFIAFANDAAFRGYSLGTQRLLMNAIVLGPGMRRH